ncbi:hypothetical protein TNCV_4544611 [Trichonephila clavipes]|nr:hypothetical protein TNCV_4544611 [Trichonephila clavipes]
MYPYKKGQMGSGQGTVRTRLQSPDHHIKTTSTICQLLVVGMYLECIVWDVIPCEEGSRRVRTLTFLRLFNGKSSRKLSSTSLRQDKYQDSINVPS